MKGNRELLGMMPSSSNMAAWALRRRMKRPKEAGRPTPVLRSKVRFRVSRTYIASSVHAARVRRKDRLRKLDEPIVDRLSEQFLNPYRQVANAPSGPGGDRAGHTG